MVQNFYVPDGSKWDDEDIVISGISARLPNCDSVEEFQNNLLSKVDLITDEPRRFQNGLYGAIKRYGLLKDLSKFDAEFFNIHPKQAERMDPQIRNLLEVAYEATVDAGLHPEDLKGTKTGVVVGIASSETQDKWSQRPDRINGYEYIGCTRTMFANRVSYFLDIKGPSYSIDTASSTTLVAFQQAYDMIKDGVCDACFVCGTDLVLNPCVCLMFQCLNMLSPEGKCKAFDINGDGYVRSEGAIAVLLQKAKVAKRVYANVLAAGSNCDGYKDEGITFPSCEMQVKLFRQVAQIANIDPKTIDFMEAHGSATRVGDPQEMNAVTEVFTKGRQFPLRTGSVKSNMGHGEPASALSAVIKMCVAMECGILPPNLHYKTPNPDIPALLDGRLKVITEPTPWEGGLVAVNSFGVGGANGHALLLSNKKQKLLTQDDVPRLVCVSGVTRSAVTTMLNKIQASPINYDLYGLLYNVHRKNIKGHAYRGFTLTNSANIISIARAPKKPREVSSLSVMFPGLESTWTSVGPDMMKLQIFQDIIRASQNELSTVVKNVDLNSVLLHLETERSLLNLVVGVTTLQIGLVHILHALEIIPYSVVGINIGEIAAGYAKGAYTLRQAILLAFEVGMVIEKYNYPSSVIKSDIPPGESNPPEDISTTVKCGTNGTMFSGPKLSMDKFTQRLKEQNYESVASDSFVVDVIGIIRRSGCISELEKGFKKILTNTPSTKWTAEYLINALTQSKKLNIDNEEPVVLEIGPASGLSGKVLSIAFGEENFDLTHILRSIGQIYNVGFQPQVQNLYPKITFPVPHGTPMIQSMVEWDHSQTWDVVSFAPKDGRSAGGVEVVVDFDKEEYKLLKENEIGGQQVFPQAFYIYLLWKTMGRLQNRPTIDFPLVLENIFFIRQTSIPSEDPVKFTVVILQTSNKFEIREGGHLVVSGEVWIPKPDAVSKELMLATLPSPTPSTAEAAINATDVYSFLSVNKYRYNNAYRSIISFDYGSNITKVKTGSWISYIEAFLQILMLNQVFDASCTSFVSFIRKTVINPQQRRRDEDVVHYNKTWNALKSDTIEMRGVELKTVPLPQENTPIVTASKFVPFVCENIENAAESSVVLALENFLGQNNLKIVELLNSAADSPLSSLIRSANPFLQANITIYSNNVFDANMNVETIEYPSKDIGAGPVDTNVHLLIARNTISDPVALENLIESVRIDGCLLLEENLHVKTFQERDNIKIIARSTSANKTYYVLKKVSSKGRKIPRVITVTSLSDCRQKLQHIPDSNTRLLIVARRSADVGGIIPFVKSVSAEAQINNLSVLLLEDEYTSSVFSLKNPIYAEQIQKEYPINVYKNGIWGAYIATSFNYDADHTTTCAPIPRRQLEDTGKIACEVLTVVNKREFEVIGKGQEKTSSISSMKMNCKVGLTFSGYEGSRKVFGIARDRTSTTSAIADPAYVWTIPNDWTFEEAATVPFAYALGYYGLKVRGSLQNGSSILIKGLNDIAIAAVSIALHYGCTVFLLLEDEKEIPLVKKSFPQMEDKNLIVSSKNDFHVNILQRTAGKGVRVLFNTVLEENHETQCNIFSLAENGTYIYFNNGHFLEQNLGSSGSMRCLTAHRITLSCLFENAEAIVKKRISQLVSDGLNDGVVRPIPHSTFWESNTIYNSRCISEKCETKEYVIQIDDWTNDLPAQNGSYFDCSKSFVILAGNSDFGAYATAHLIALGVRKLVLLHTTLEPQNLHLSNFLLQKVTEKTSCAISRVAVDNFSVKSCEKLLQDANQIAPLGGVFDFTEIKVDTPESSILSDKVEQKVNFITNTDLITRKLFPRLRHFVSFSLFELEYGQAGYSVLAFANGMIQTLMRSRKDVGLNGTLIQWGKVGECSDDILYNDLKLSLTCTPPQPVMSCLQTMDRILRSGESVVSSFLAAEYVEIQTDSKVNFILEGVAKFLGIRDPSSIRSSVTMLELGLDSLISTDIQQFLENNYGITLSTQEVRELTFEKLRMLAENF